MESLLDALRESGPHRVFLWMLVFTILFTVTARFLTGLYKRKAKKTDIDRVVELARLRDCAEFEIFREAALPWNYPESGVEEDFKQYLLQDRLPFYVTRYLREQAAEKEA